MQVQRKLIISIEELGDYEILFMGADDYLETIDKLSRDPSHIFSRIRPISQSIKITKNYCNNVNPAPLMFINILKFYYDVINTYQDKRVYQIFRDIILDDSSEYDSQSYKEKESAIKIKSLHINSIHAFDIEKGFIDFFQIKQD